MKLHQEKLQVNDLVQIDPDCCKNFGGMILCVTEKYKWGVQGYLWSAYNFEATKYKGRAYLRKLWEDIEFVGRLEWMLYDKEDESVMTPQERSLVNDGCDQPV